MNDLLPAEAPLWEWFEARVADWLRSYGYQQIRTPIVEYTELFGGHRRGHRHRRKGDVLLRGPAQRRAPDAASRVHRRRDARDRPSTTSLTTRHAVSGPWPRCPPRAASAAATGVLPGQCRGGRFAGPDIDAEQIVMLARLWEDPRIDRVGRVRLELNCLGQATSGRGTVADLIAYLSQHSSAGCRCQAPTPHQPAAHPRNQEPGARGNSGRSARASPPTSGESSSGAFRGAGKALLQAAGIESRSTAHAARTRLLQPHCVRVDH